MKTNNINAYNVYSMNDWSYTYTFSFLIEIIIHSIINNKMLM